MVTSGEAQLRVAEARAGKRLDVAVVVVVLTGFSRLSTSLGTFAGICCCFALSLDFGRPRFFFGGSSNSARRS